MKKVLSCLLVVLTLASLLAMGVGAMWDEADPAKFMDYGAIANVDRRSVRLDAKKDAAYAAATPIPIATPTQEKNEGKTATNGVAYFVYDSEYIWVFIEVNDVTLNTAAPSPLESGYKQDSVEILMDWENKGEKTKDVTPYQSRVTHEGFVSGRLGEGTRLYGTAEQGATAPVDYLDAYAIHREDGTGYDCELRILPPYDKFQIGDRIGLGFIINDYDENGANRITLNSNTIDRAAGGNWECDRLGSIKFDHSAPYTADTTIIYVVAAMAAAVVIGTVTLVSLKKKAR